MVANDKLFGCPYCGFRIGPGEDRCARCGNHFGESTKFECPFCGDLVSPNMQECPACHVNFAEFQTRVRRTAKTDSVDTLLMEIIRLEATEVAREGKKLSCPNCDVLLDGSEASCPRCGVDLTEGSAFQCPVCGEFVAPEAMDCPVCGASFTGGRTGEEEARAEADHEAASNALEDLLSSAAQRDAVTSSEPTTIEPEPLPAPPEDFEPPPPPEVAPEEMPLSSATSVAYSDTPTEAAKKPKVRKLKTKTDP